MDPNMLTAAWMAGPPPAALAEIEVAEEIEPPTPVATRTEGDGFEDHVRMYLREIGTVPLLTWDGERRLAGAREAGIFLQDVIRRPAEAAGAPSVPAMYHELYGHLRVVYRFALADARVDVPAADGWDAMRRSARLADIDPEHLRAVAQLAEAALDETERGMVLSSIISHILPDELLRWCAAHDLDGELPDADVFRADFLAHADPDVLDHPLAH